MSKAKFAAARQLIQEKKYDQAREILKTINHPTAKEWLQKLDRISPPFRKSHHPKLVFSLVFFGVLVLTVALIAIVILVPALSRGANIANTVVPPTPTISEEEKIEAVTMYCMQQAQDSNREDCTIFAQTLVSDLEFSDTISHCTLRYAGNLDAFSVCMQDIANELDERYKNAVLQPLLLGRYCSGYFTLAAIEGNDPECLEWAIELDLLHPALRSRQECWGNYEIGEYMYGDAMSEMPNVITCMHNNLGSDFPQMPPCDDRHPNRATCNLQ